MRRITLAITVAGVLVTPAQAIDISKQPTKNMTCSGGVCTPTASKAVLNVGDLTSMLASGDLSVQTGNGDDTSAGIIIVNSFSWTNSSKLTLTAKNNIIVKAPVTVAGTGALTLTYAKGNPEGDLLFVNKGKIDFWDTGSELIINGNDYQLVGDIASLAAGITMNPSGAFALANDYDATANGVYHQPPVTTTFAGVFDGLGHSISNLSMSSEKNDPCGTLALFSNANGQLRDINLVNVNISVVCSLAEDSAIGSLVGWSGGTIENVRIVASINIQKGEAPYVGGVAGACTNLKRAVARVSVTAYAKNGYIGGLCGTASSILLSGVTGTVSGGRGSIIGGVASDTAMMDQSYSTVSVTGDLGSSAGGLVGGSYYHSISNSYAVGDVRGRIVGGLLGVGWEEDIISSYSAGAVLGRTAGGFIGDGFGRCAFSNDYWDVDTSGAEKGCGKDTCSGVFGITDEELKAKLPAGFDSKIWGQSPNINNGYPYLLANPPPQ